MPTDESMKAEEAISKQFSTVYEEDRGRVAQIIDESLALPELLHAIDRLFLRHSKQCCDPPKCDACQAYFKYEENRDA